MVINIMKKLKYIFITFYFLLSTFYLFSQEQRFPKPEFETGYEQPSTITPEPRALALEYFDVLILIIVL